MLTRPFGTILYTSAYDEEDDDIETAFIRVFNHLSISADHIFTGEKTYAATQCPKYGEYMFLLHQLIG